MLKLNRNMEITKKETLIIIAAVLLIGLAVGGYFLWNNWKNSISSENKALENAGEAAEKITESATKGVLPSIGTNPLENKPDVNPVDKTNPFKNIITNPFNGRRQTKISRNFTASAGGRAWLP